MMENVLDIENLVEALCRTGTFQMILHMNEDGIADYYIPYLMNDAAECYILLKNCRVRGEIQKEYDGDTEAEFADNGLIVKQGENVYTVWFFDAELKCCYYQYHRIGHFWRQGQEHWRRLVYIIGTIFDKYKYLGRESCNDEELKVMQLLGFEPLRDWSPIDEPFDIFYDTNDFIGLNGTEFIIQIAENTGCHFYKNMAKLYKKVKLPGLKRMLKNMLTLNGSRKIYDYINEMIDSASLKYPERVYEDEMEARINAARNEISHILASEGYEGSYPSFLSENERIIAYEEHPYVINELEYEGFDFAVHLMKIERKGKFSRVAVK